MGEVLATEGDPELRRIRARYERSFRAGETIFEPGDPARELYIVQVGEVEVLRPTGSGTRPVDRVRPGEFFGEMSVVLGGRRSVRAVALTEARVLEIDRDTFQTMCLDRPEIALRVIERLTVRVLQLEERMGTLAVTELIRSVVAVLIDVASPEGSEHRVELSLRHIAAGAGLSMLDAHRAVQELIDLKLVRLEQDLLWVADLDALRSYPDGTAA
jgi:CRP/FNR family cyclic AMP-dependent transcriptional regulator